MFRRWGAFVYRFRRIIVVLALVAGGVMSTLAARTADELVAGGWLDPASESAGVSDRLRAEFGTGESDIVALFRTSTGLAARSPGFQAAIAEAVAPLAGDARVTGVTGFAETGDDGFISKAGDAAFVVIGLDMTEEESVAVTEELTGLVVPPDAYTVTFTGYGPIQLDATEQEERDLRQAEMVSLPIAALVLLAVFASIVAAGMPLLVAGLAIPTALGLEFLVAQRTDMSIYVLSVTTMLGLGLAIDYSLFITSRFREELARGRAVGAAVERAVATAGKAVVFSGIAVAIGQAGLLWFAASAISSIGIGGSIVVGCSVLFALTFLPAVLGMLGPRVNALSVAGLLRRIGLHGDPIAGRTRWERVAHTVMRRPFAVLLPTLGFLLLVGSPFLRIEQGVPGADVYPPGLPSRDTWVALQTEFDLGQTMPITVLADVSGESTDEVTIAAILELSHRIAALDGVDAVEGPFALTDPVSGAPLSAAAVAALYAASPGTLPPPVEAGIARLRETYLRDGVVQLTAVSPLPSTRPEGTAVARAIRSVALPDGIEHISVGGVAAIAADFLDSQAERMPWALGTTLIASAVVLFLLFGSIAIPIKAVLMTLLSLSASFGALVWIFQDGNLADALDFERLGYTIAGNPIIMFAALIGLSMDYEVLLLSRVQEAYRRSGDNAASVAEGLARTASVITGAALIMVSVFAAFALAQTLTVKALGVGLAIAVFLDATVIRVLLVPATMRLLGRWNWWAPGPLGRLAARLGFSHAESEG